MSKSIYDVSIWQARPTKLAILIPCRETVYSLFTSALVELVKTTTMAGIDVHVVYDQSTILLSQREKLAKEALRMKADYALWLDSDMLFPSTTAMRLMGHNKDIVCGNYMKRSYPLKTVAYEERGDWDSWVPLESQEELQEVEGIGMGCMMIKTEILKKIEAPFFEFEYYDGDWHGEDFYFQNKLRDVGYKIWVDMNLSRQIHHVGQWAFGQSITTNDEKIIERHVKKIKKTEKSTPKQTTPKVTPVVEEKKVEQTPIETPAVDVPEIDNGVAAAIDAILNQETSVDQTPEPTKKVIKRMTRKKKDAE